ncbi:UDP-N-acetylmuramoyl-tripeptide--D-alanyl-D-alanine ligase [Nocardioides yefusunii]|uniref:UDP-N-acetylmuramoyl-tripeptide--D-alanyl-D-alanine ligase n=1 Tax=Nocardioides yefusunii TaxID=2500546 RepID=A0ABW1QWT2_9ACTN|nr:UDP-N-acetylmuramoyl-tripeptide--D-alanyl-D-alanine ligase [Nocardioides yefusunii]
MDLAEIARAVAGTVGRPQDADVVVSGPAVVDSRGATPGGLFVAVVGERVDGHDYVPAAMERGAVAVLCTRPVDAPHVLVEDPVVALGLLAHHLLDRLEHVTVLAMTGSQGKTGTKDYLAQVLGGVAPTVSTAGNNNNELGVPLTVLRADASTRHLVVEMGARGIGHVAELCAIARPQVSAVLNIGTAHVGEFGSRENIALAKGEIVESLASDGTAVLNADDEFTSVMGPRTAARVMTFGLSGDADVRAEDVEMDVLGRPAFTLVHRTDAGEERAGVVLTHIGAHQVSNALAAAAMALAVGVDLSLVAHGLGTTGGFSRWRMEPHVRGDGLLVVNDTYNANPESMRAAVEALAHIGTGRTGRTVAVLGEMRELGETSAAGHRSVGTVVGQLGIDVLVTVGEAASAVAAGARDVADWTGEAVVTASRDEAVRWLSDNVRAADAVLVKASRGAALEHVVDELLVEGTAVR